MTDAEKERQALAERQAKLDALVDPLPGSVPYDNRRPFTVPGEYDGATLGAALSAVFPHLSREHWQAIVDEQRLVDSAEQPVVLERVVRAGEYYAQLKPAMTEPAVNARVRLLYEDEAIVVLSKPAPLPMHPGGRFKRNTLDYFLTQIYVPHHPRPAHRLDANTSGLVVCSRTRRIAGRLQPQFTEGKVEKTYLARVHGRPAEKFFTCEAAIGDESGPGGNRSINPVNGRAARTQFKIITYRESDDTTVLEAKPLTGRTHQIRLHLQHLGHPVVGDLLYGRSPAKEGGPGTLPVDAPPLCLHSWKLSFAHPLTGAHVDFEDEKPNWV